MIRNFPCSSCKKECASELAGTYLLVLIGPASIIASSLISILSATESQLFVTFCFGGTVALAILLFGKHSGAFINPAITLSASLAKLIRSRMLLPFIGFQVLGGLLAGVTLRIILGSISVETNLGTTKLANGISPVSGIILEAVGTFILASSAMIASTRISSRTKQAILVGTTLSVLILLIGPLTGAGFNPARSLGPSVASGYLENLYVYLIGPMLGAALAGLIFRMMRKSGRRSFDIICMC